MMRLPLRSIVPNTCCVLVVALYQAGNVLKVKTMSKSPATLPGSIGTFPMRSWNQRSHSAEPGAGEFRYGLPASGFDGGDGINGNRNEFIPCFGFFTSHCAVLWQLMQDEFLPFLTYCRLPSISKEISFIAPSFGPDKRWPQPSVSAPYAGAAGLFQFSISGAD